MPVARAPRIARALRVPDGDGDDAADAPQVVHADRDRPRRQLRRDERPVRVERDGRPGRRRRRAPTSPRELVRRRGRPIARARTRPARRRPGIAPIPTTARSSDPNRATVSASSGSRNEGGPERRSVSTNVGREDGVGGRAEPIGQRRAPAHRRRHRGPGERELPASCTTVVSSVPARGDRADDGCQGGSPGDPDRVAVADQAVEDGAGQGTSGRTRSTPRPVGAIATAHRSSPNRSSIAPASSRSSAGTSRYSIRTRPSARAPSMQAGDAEA